jgi:hypothetical protein
METIGKILGLFLSSALLALLGAAVIKLAYNKSSPLKITYAQAYKSSISAFVAGAAAAIPAFYMLTTRVPDAVVGSIVGFVAIAVHLAVIYVRVSNENVSLKRSILIGLANLLVPIMLTGALVATVNLIANF